MTLMRVSMVAAGGLWFASLAAAQSTHLQLSTDPSRGEVPLACAADWRAHLVFEAGVGVWTVTCAQVQPWLGCPEILAMDDRGRCTVLRSYSGKWTPQPTVEDGLWLAPVAHGDLDPSVTGLEIYTGGQGGRLWQIHPRWPGQFETRVTHEWPGKEIHALVLHDLDPSRDGAEMLVFLASGEVFEAHLVDGSRNLRVSAVGVLPGRVRQAVVLSAAAGEPPWIATVSRSGHLALVRPRGETLEQRVLAHESMGLGRIAAPRAGDGSVLYVTRDDGLVLRFAATPGGGGEVRREVIYAGPQGPRGIAAGRFHSDPRRECVAVFGYCGRVELLSRLPKGAWDRTTVFTDTDKGHWLERAELDGRNGTDELIGCGYSGRVFLLSRPPGYGLAAANAAIDTTLR